MYISSKLFRCLILILLISVSVSAYSLGFENPPIYDSEQSSEKPISGSDAVKKMTLPDGFEAKLFADEPMVRNPIALQYDGSGRLWIAENFTYAERGLRIDPNLRDRLVIFHDSNHDGKADSSTVFSDSLHNLTGFAIGRGGVWAICPPQLLFIADKNQDDKPDGLPQVILDGFTVASENHHNFANGLKFGPDGWLYGRIGGSAPAFVGKPGTIDKSRIPIYGGIWRYHPKTSHFEVLTHGTTNPWGMDWDQNGEAFFVNTVNGQLWHLIPGSHLDRLHTVDPNPNAYQLMQQTADHFHYDTGQGWIASRDGAANSLGGGHAHQGALIYQGGTWPEKYNGRLFMINFHGRRINTERLSRQGSGFIGSHEKDLALFGDTWFRGLDMASAPNGNIVVIDWSDTGECHENTGVHRSSGRIYEIGVKAEKHQEFKEFKASNVFADLTSDNIFYARRSLDQIADNPDQFKVLKSDLLKLLHSDGPARNRLRSLWALNSLGLATESLFINLSKDSEESVRTWAIRLLMDSFPMDTIQGDRKSSIDRQPSKAVIQTLLSLAETDKSGLVRLAIASSIQRLSENESRIALAKLLVRHQEDSNDLNLPLLVWYGIASVADKDPLLLKDVYDVCQWPLLSKMITRRLASTLGESQKSESLNLVLASAGNKSVATQNSTLEGLIEGLTGRDKVLEPDSWKAFAKKFPTEKTQELAALFGDGVALDSIRKLALDNKQEMKTRRNALRTLVERNPPDINHICMTLLGIRYLNSEAIQGLSRTDDPVVAQRIVDTYQNFALPERPMVIDVLTQRPTWARILLEAVAKGRINRQDISVSQARKIIGFNDKVTSDSLLRHWGRIVAPSESKLKFGAQVKAELADTKVSQDDFKLGREMYMKSCGQCHTLYGEGGRIGPDITGAQRQNLDYLLENIVEPSAAVSPDFRLTNIQMSDGRVLSGLVRPRDQQSLTLITANQTIILAKTDIEAQRATDQSIMPEGQLEAMNVKERTALLRYLMTESPPVDGR